LNQAVGADSRLERSAKDVEPEPSQDRQPYGVEDAVARVPTASGRTTRTPISVKNTTAARNTYA
jgi:hypothetical protein